MIVAADHENQARVFAALATLPDHAAGELQPGELQQYDVIRVADEILVDVMRSAGGIEYAEAAADSVIHHVDGVPIPFASPRLLWRMKSVTHREKDAAACPRLPTRVISRRLSDDSAAVATRR